MKLKDFKTIMEYLPDDIEITVGEVVSTPRLVKEFWGNHDGRYNVKCEACGWTSADIPRNGYPPHVCGKCGKGTYQGD